MLRPKIKKMTTKEQVVIHFEDCLAKTRRCQDKILPGRTVVEHCCIVGTLAKALLEFYPHILPTQLSGDDFAFLASLHDLGKITPEFQKKLRKIISGGSSEASAIEERYQFHGGATYISLRDDGFQDCLAWALGSHHRILVREHLSFIDASNSFLGGVPWQEERNKTIKKLADFFNVSSSLPLLDDWRSRALVGLVEQADWLGSGDIFDDPTTDWGESVPLALEQAGYRQIDVIKKLCFSDIFGFQPRAIQQSFIETVTGPGVYILEAPMGVGKTEAALYAAYKMLASGKASGIYYALPTRLTSFKIKDRVDQFLSRIVTDASNVHARLVVGNQSCFSGELAPGGLWFSNKHRRILDRFGVGTLDQALFAVMLNRRSFATLSALTGKVVILDEVHSYDFYTRVFLQLLVKHLKDLGCTVLILSATLAEESKKSLLGVSEQDVTICEKYPLISAQRLNEKAIDQRSLAVTKLRNVLVRLTPNIEEALTEALLRAKQGQQVLWIENSVKDAQTIFSKLSQAEENDIEIGLVHSRFLPLHRQKLEEFWVTLFGKNSLHRADKGRILVGTQVLEQSLDIDADFLVTRLAPVDLLMQRMGRLWRHETTERPREAKEETWIIVPGTTQEALEGMPESFSATCAVYFPYVLMRTLQAIESFNGKTLQLPTKMREMLALVYQAREESGEWEVLRQKMFSGDKKRLGITQQELLAKRAAVTEECTKTRLSEESLDVLLIKSMTADSVLKQTQITTIDGQILILPWGIKDKQQKAMLAQKLENQVLTIRKNYGMPVTDPLYLKKEFHLDEFLYLGEENSGIWVAEVTSEGNLVSFGNDEISHFSYRFGNLGSLGFENLKRK